MHEGELSSSSVNSLISDIKSLDKKTDHEFDLLLDTILITQQKILATENIMRELNILHRAVTKKEAIYQSQYISNNLGNYPKLYPIEIAPLFDSTRYFLIEISLLFDHAYKSKQLIESIYEKLKFKKEDRTYIQPEVRKKYDAILEETKKNNSNPNQKIFDTVINNNKKTT